ncbi:MAG: hypothetical protein KJN87_07700 [Desulfofustis sp.]|nr:hypothetical protein [Desulfofustis sp.]
MPDQWHDPRTFGVTIRSVLVNVDIVIGTEDEINATMEEVELFVERKGGF